MRWSPRATGSEGYLGAQAHDPAGSEPSVARKGPEASCVRADRAYRASAGNRWAGLACTGLVYAAVLGALLLAIPRALPTAPPPSALTAIDLTAPASPADTPPKPKDAPRPTDKKQEPRLQQAPPIERALIAIAPPSVPVSVVTAKPVRPEPAEPETAAPRTTPAPPAPQVSSNAPETWEGRLLAALNKHRRYPREAMMRRQQGVPFIRIVIDREGKVLSSRLERSSGIPELDREAVALPRRASPLPKPPKERPGDTLDLVVPVEFFLR